jgi:hypothetical protein
MYRQRRRAHVEGGCGKTEGNQQPIERRHAGAPLSLAQVFARRKLAESNYTAMTGSIGGAVRR